VPVRDDDGPEEEMVMASEGLHEPQELMQSATIDRHRAITSIKEELEAVDWYDQRVDATSDDALAAVLAHNRDEEKEHACMTLEWLRRHDPVLDGHLRTYLFTTAPVTEIEVEAEAGTGSSAAGSSGAGAPAAGSSAAGSSGAGSLGIGSLKGVN